MRTAEITTLPPRDPIFALGGGRGRVEWTKNLAEAMHFAERVHFLPEQMEERNG
jgi:hypothetical protein